MTPTLSRQREVVATGIGWSSQTSMQFGHAWFAIRGQGRSVRKAATKKVVKLKTKAVKTNTVPYDVAAQLRTTEERAAYLDAWLDEAPDDVAGIARALGDIARAKGMAQVARDVGLSRESLYKALSADGNPSFATVLKVARALGVKLHAEAG